MSGRGSPASQHDALSAAALDALGRALAAVLASAADRSGEPPFGANAADNGSHQKETALLPERGPTESPRVDRRGEIL